MKKQLCILVVLCMFLSAGDVYSQCSLTWRGSGGWGASTDYAKLFNPKTVETINGKILKIDKMTPASNMQQGAYMLMETKQGNITVHLGPVWFIENQDVRLNPQDKIEVTGSRVKVNDQTVIIASEIRRGGDVMVLRDEKGRPAWSAWKRK